MPETPEESAVAPRRTAMQVAEQAATTAQNAMALAHAVDNDLGENIRPPMTQLRQDLTDLREELGGYQAGIGRQLEKLTERVGSVEAGAGITESEDQVHSMVEANLAAVLARLEAAERTLASLEARPTTYTAPEDPRIPGLASELGAALDRLAVAERRLSTVGAINDAPTGGEGYATALQIRVAALEKRLANPIRSDVDSHPFGVHGKVLELMRKVTSIGKDKDANLGEGGRFKFRGVDAAMDAVGHAMREVGLTLETEILHREYDTREVTKSSQRGNYTVLWTTARVVVRYTFVDPEDGSRHVFEMAGEGRDASDKATSKATSMAVKYGLFQALMIPVTGLDDSDNESPEITRDVPARTDQGVSQPPAATDQASRQQRARDALAALRALDKFPLAEARGRLEHIQRGIEKEGLGNAEVDGATLRAHVAAIAKTMPPAQTPEPPPAEPPADDTPPWS